MQEVFAQELVNSGGTWMCLGLCWLASPEGPSDPTPAPHAGSVTSCKAQVHSSLAASQALS